MRTCSGDCYMCTNSGDCPDAFGCNEERADEKFCYEKCYRKKDILWAFDTSIELMKKSENVSWQAVKCVEALRNQIDNIVPTYECKIDYDKEEEEDD